MTLKAGSLKARTKLAYGLGSVAYGIKDGGFGYFFLIFYSQVMGVDASLVGLALFLALLFDAFSDPLIGYLSDNTRSRWGRRHPYMYAAVIPVAVAYYFVWNPPAGLQGNALFPYMLLMAILVRTLITLYEIPCSSLIAELTSDYNERTKLQSYRFASGWSGGILFTAFALAVLLVPEEGTASGIFNVEGYGRMGLYASFFIMASILICTLGTHRHIPDLHQVQVPLKLSLGRIYREIIDTLATRSMAGIMLVMVFGTIASGLSSGISFYLSTFFWEFTTQQISLLTVSLLVSALVSIALSPMLSIRFGKKRGAFIVGLSALVLGPAPVLLRLLGLMPENGDPLLFPIILVLQIVDVGLVIVFQTLAFSMVADMVEDSEVRTQRRSEGVFFAAINFARKINQGLGLVMASTVLTLIQFPTEATPGEISVETIRNLGLAYVPALAVPWALMMLCLSMYSINRARHEDNLRKLGRA